MRYKDCKLGYGTIVNAEYQSIDIDRYKGNIFIEALPNLSLESKDVIRRYTKKKDVDENIAKIPRSQRRIMATNIGDIRVSLPFEERLETEFITSIRESYVYRRIGTVNIGQEQEKGLIANPIEGTNGGFCLLGCSGSGKSSAVKMMLDNYPQVITHRLKDGTVINQIVYLIVNCLPNSNFEALYISIGEAIDQALETNCYESFIKNSKTLGGKLNAVKKLVEAFSIGTIIFDEIQLINFDSTKENSFESLMTLANNTKVAISVIGTEEAYEKMFKKLRTARRSGKLIPADAYCRNKKYYQFILQEIYKTQYFDVKQTLTPEIVDAFYKSTGGIICLTIMLYKLITDEYLKKTNHYNITPSIITNAANKYYGALKDLSDTEKVDELVDTLNDNYEKELSSIEQEKIMNNIIKSSSELEKEDLIENIISKLSFLDIDKNKLKAECINLLNSGYSDKNEITKKIAAKFIKTKKSKVNPQFVIT